MIELTEAEREKLRRLCYTGSPQSRRAARELLAGRLPSSFDAYCLSQTLNRASWRADRNNDNDHAA